MANLPESNSFDNVYQLEVTDKATGGLTGTANLQAKQLANRTKWLRSRVVWGGVTNQSISSVTLAASDMNRIHACWITANSVTMTMPAISTCVAGDKIRIENSSSSTQFVFINLNAADASTPILDINTSALNIIVSPGEAVEIGLVDIVTGWRILQRDSKVVHPVGSLLVYPVTAVPLGYLHCDGSAVSRSTYANLFALLGTLYGAGDGSTTFNLPDYRGEFLRVWDNSRNVDVGRGIGTFQAATVVAAGTGAIGQPRNIAVNVHIKY